MISMHLTDDPSRRLRLAAAVAFALAAGTAASGAAQAQDCKDPEALRFSIIPTEETIQELTLYKPVVDYLSEQTGKKIEFYMPTSYASVIEAMLGGWVDIAVLGPESYVIGRSKSDDIEVFATYAKAKGILQEEGPGYSAVLLTRKDSKFTDVASLEGALLGLVDPASTSGNLLPRVTFAEEIGGIELEDYFSKVVYTGSHDKSVIAVKEGKVDAAFVATHRFDNVVGRELASLDEFNVLWRSQVVPQDPFSYRASLCPELKEKIRETFLSLDSVPAGEQYLANVNAIKFVPMSDSDYDLIRKLVEAEGKSH